MADSVDNVVIGCGAAGFACVRGLKGSTLLLADEDHRTRKWRASKHLPSEKGIQDKNWCHNIPASIEKEGLKNITFKEETITDIDTGKKEVVGKNGSYRYENLVLATGGIANVPPGLREAVDDPNQNVITYDRYPDFATMSGHLKDASTVTFVGAGPIGFEGSIGLTMLSRLSEKHKNLKVNLVEFDDDPLPKMLASDLYFFVRKGIKLAMGLMGINRYFNTGAESYRDGILYCKKQNGDEVGLKSDVVVIAIGVAQNIPPINGKPFGRERSLVCDNYGKAYAAGPRGEGQQELLPNVWAAGDATLYIRKPGGEVEFPASAIFAERGGKIIGHNISNPGNMKGIDYEPFLMYRGMDMVYRRFITTHS